MQVKNQTYTLVSSHLYIRYKYKECLYSIRLRVALHTYASRCDTLHWKLNTLKKTGRVTRWVVTRGKAFSVVAPWFWNTLPRDAWLAATALAIQGAFLLKDFTWVCLNLLLRSLRMVVWKTFGSTFRPPCIAEEFKTMASTWLPQLVTGLMNLVGNTLIWFSSLGRKTLLSWSDHLLVWFRQQQLSSEETSLSPKSCIIQLLFIDGSMIPGGNISPLWMMLNFP